MKKRRSVGIHDGAFHADEVTACALLMLFDCIDRDKIVRTRKSELLKGCEYVCDVGGFYDPHRKLFDHHQITYNGDMSSAGMILRYLKEQKKITDSEYHFFNQMLVLGVDAHDNGQSIQQPGVCTFSHIISSFNPVEYDIAEEVREKSFFLALDFTFNLLQRMHERYNYNFKCRSIVENAMADRKLCLIFDTAIPWVESFFSLNGKSHPALFVIMPAKEHWKLRGIPPDNEHRMQVRLPLPEEWAGLLEEEMKAKVALPGGIFCHKGRFTSVWETKEDALLAMKYILDKEGIAYEDSF